MDCTSIETRRILDTLGHDIPLTWKEEMSGIQIVASQFEMLQALFGMNEILSQGGFVTLEDFLMSINDERIIFPPDFDVNVLGSGWSRDCFECWDYLWIDIRFDKECVGDKIIFVFNFVVPYCSECANCNGCDAPSYYDWASSQIAKQTAPIMDDQSS